MPIDTSVYGGITTPKINTPFEALDQVLKTRKMVEDRQAEIASQRDKAMTAQAIQQAYQQSRLPNGDADVPRIVQQLQTSGHKGAIDAAVEIQKQWDAHRKTQIDADIAANDLATKKATRLAQYTQGVEDQADYDLLIQLVPEIGQMLGPQFDKAKLTRLQSGAMSVKEYNDRENEIRTRGLKDGLSAMFELASHAKTPEMWEKAKAFGVQNGVNLDMASSLGEFTPENVAMAGQRALGPAKAADVANAQVDNTRQDAAAVETARHNRAMEGVSQQNANRLAAQGAGGRGGSRPVTSGDANRIAEMRNSLRDLTALRTALTETKNATGTLAGVEASLPNFVTNATGVGVAAKSRQAVIDRVKQVIGKALEGGVLRKEDENKYIKILPTISDNDQVAQSKLDGLDAAIQRKLEEQLSSLEDAGYNTTAYRTRQQGPTPSAPAKSGAKPADPLGIR